jgi:hypothetical protein
MTLTSTPRWNRTHLDYALAEDSPAFEPGIRFRPTDLASIGLRPSWFEIFDGAQKGSRSAGAMIQSETADRAFGLYLEPSFGISFPTNPGPLSPIAASAFAKYGSVDFGGGGGLKKVRMRACLPGPASRIPAAAAVVLRADSPDGPVVARVALLSRLAHANCGYLIGSYWAPGVMNDDRAAMQETPAALEAAGLALAGRRDVFLSVEGGGHVAVDWFRFE